MKSQTQNRIFLFEILKGISKLKEGLYFKHPTVLEELEGSFIDKELEQRGRSIGLLNEEELIANAIRSGKYTEELEAEIKDLNWVIKKKKRVISKISDAHMVKSNEESLERDQKRLAEIQAIRASFAKDSLEAFVRTKNSLQSCVKHCFVDENCTELIKPEIAKEVFPSYYQRFSELSSLDNLLNISYLPDYFELIRLSEDPLFIYGKNSTQITSFQRDILICAKVLKLKIENISSIPPNVKNDPVKLYHFIPKKDGDKETEEIRIREHVESKGGVENIKPEDKIT